MAKLLEIHNRITFCLFSNLEKYVNINKVADDLEINWRTVRRHLRLMSNGYLERNKLRTTKLNQNQEVR